MKEATLIEVQQELAKVTAQLHEVTLLGKVAERIRKPNLSSESIKLYLVAEAVLHQANGGTLTQISNRYGVSPAKLMEYKEQALSGLRNLTGETPDTQLAEEAAGEAEVAETHSVVDSGNRGNTYPWASTGFIPVIAGMSVGERRDFVTPKWATTHEMRNHFSGHVIRKYGKGTFGVYLRPEGDGVFVVRKK